MTEEQKHQKDLERLRKLRPIDDDFMRCLFKDNIPRMLAADKYALEEIAAISGLSPDEVESLRPERGV